MKITLNPSDSLYNAGLIGLYNILKFNNENVELTEDNLIFDSSSLENFSEKYFNYISQKYSKYLSVNNLISYKDILTEDISIQELKKITTDFKKIVSKSYMSIFELLKENRIIELYSSLKTIDKKSTKKDIQEQLFILNAIIDRLKIKEVYKHLCAVNSAYTVINKTYENVAFFNPSNKERDFFKVYNKAFSDKALEYINEPIISNLSCSSCHNPIENYDNEYSFIIGLGYPSQRKANFGYNFNNDKAMCPLCKLVYTCICAGSTFKYDDGFFINFNSNLKTMLELNDKLFNVVLEATSSNHTFYKFIIENMDKYDFNYVQILKYNNNSIKPYVQSILLNEEYINILKICNDNLLQIGNDSFEFAGEKINIFTCLNELLYNNYSLDTFINMSIYSKLTEKYFIKESTLNTLLKINYYKNGGTMAENNDIKQARIEGYKLRDQYIKLGLKDKIKQNSYTLFQAINSKPKFEILNIIIKLYLYAKMELPSLIAKIQDMTDYKIILQGFLVGFMSSPYKKNVTENEDEDEKN